MSAAMSTRLAYEELKNLQLVSDFRTYDRTTFRLTEKSRINGQLKVAMIVGLSSDKFHDSY